MRSGASGASDWRTTRSWTRSAPSTRRSARTDIAADWVDELSAPLDATFRGAILHPGDGSLQPARWVRRLAGRAVAAGTEIVEETRVESLDDLDAEHIVIATDGYTSGLLPELDRTITPVRGQVIVDRAAGGDAVSTTALRAPRVRLLAADAGRQARPRRPARQEPRRGVHQRGGAHGADPGRARELRGRARRRRATHRAPLAGDLRLDRGPPPAGGPGSGPRRSLGLSRLLGPRQRHGPRLRRARGAGDPRFACARAPVLRSRAVDLDEAV